MTNLLASTRDLVTTAVTGKRPESGRVVEPSAILDAPQAKLTAGITFAQLIGKMTAARMGDVAIGLRLFEEIEQEDSTIQSVANTRRLALTGLDHEIVSAADVQDIEDRKLADEAADFVREQLTRLDTLDGMLEHLANAIGWNLAVVELVWQGNRVVDTVNAPSNRLRIEPTEPNVIRVITPDDYVGTPAVGPKWIVHIPRSVSCGSPVVRSLAWTSAFLFLSAKVAATDWVTFCELFGMPIRVGTYRSGASVEEKAEMVDWLEHMGRSAWAVFNEACNMQFIETPQRGTAPYEAFLAWANRAMAKVWLGGNLTADTTGGTGTHAAASVQDEVRGDLRDDDIKREGYAIRRQLIAPMVAYEFRRPVPLPYFRRIKPEVIDRVREANLFLAAQRAGVKIPQAHAYKILGIPEPSPDEDTLTPSLDAFGDGLAEGSALVGS